MFNLSVLIHNVLDTVLVSSMQRFSLEGCSCGGKAAYSCVEAKASWQILKDAMKLLGPKARYITLDELAVVQKEIYAVTQSLDGYVKRADKSSVDRSHAHIHRPRLSSCTLKPLCASCGIIRFLLD